MCGRCKKGLPCANPRVYFTEADRIEARRRTWRESKRATPEAKLRRRFADSPLHLELIDALGLDGIREYGAGLLDVDVAA